MEDSEVVNGEVAYLTPRQAGLLLGVKSCTLQHWNNIGKISAIKLNSGHRRYPYSEVKRILAEDDKEEFLKKEETFVDMAVKEIGVPLVKKAIGAETKGRDNTDPNLKLQLTTIKEIIKLIRTVVWVIGGVVAFWLALPFISNLIGDLI